MVTMAKDLLLFYMSDQRYEYFIPLFCYFAFKSNPEAAIEIWTPNTNKFGYLTNFFDVQTYPLDPKARNVNMLRFLHEPNRKYPYTYIGDIDILLMESIMKAHLPLVGKGVPLSNMIRETNPPRATGLQFVISDPYFKDTRELRKELMKLYYPQRNDEWVLYNLIKDTYGTDILTQKNPKKLRPVLGIHCSTNRMPYKTEGYKCNWGLTEAYRKRAVKWMSEPKFKLLEPFLQPKAKKIVDFLRDPGIGWVLDKG